MPVLKSYRNVVMCALKLRRKTRIEYEKKVLFIAKIRLKVSNETKVNFKIAHQNKGKSCRL